MPTIQIADKPTLDSVKTTVEAMGGIKYNSTTSKPQIYDTTNSAWVDFESGGGGGESKITIFNDNSAYTNKVFTIAHETELFSTTATLTGASVSTTVPYLGRYLISWTNASSQTLQQAVTVVGAGDTVFSPLTITDVSPFATISDAELLTVLEAHYYDKIDLSKYWSVGDTRNVTLSAMSATGVGESHDAQVVEMVITDFNHDTLVTPINGHTKAAITMQQVHGLYNRGYMNSINTNQTGWTNSARRTWCNNVYYNALPSGLKTLVKQVNKLTSAGNKSSTINTTQDYVYLVSEVEVFGTNTNSFAGEGTQYPYYAVSSNRIKNSAGAANSWWERSPTSAHSTYFCCVGSSGAANSNSASSALGVAPALSI